jgi:hypothetical protein
MPFVPARDLPRYGAFVRAVQASGAGTLAVPKGGLWALVAVPVAIGALLCAAFAQR